MKLSQLKRIHLIVLAVCLQVGAVGYIVADSYYPHLVGKEIHLAIRPVDPRSLFRGQYVRLNLGIRRVSRSKFGSAHSDISAGDTVYVTLEERGSVWEVVSASRRKPAEGTFLRGRVNQAGKGGGAIVVEYGLEAYFASPDRALELERQMRDRSRSSEPAVALVKVAPNGKSALVELKL